MKKIILFSILFLQLFIIQSCDVNESDKIIDETPFTLSVGNKYSFSHSTRVINDPNSTSWFTSDQIIKDTLANGMKYFVFDNGLKLRADDKIVYSLVNNSDKIYFSFNSSVGDTILFDNHNYTLKKFRTSNDFFGESLLLYTISNEIFAADSIIQYSFSKKFGVVDYSLHYVNTINSFYLDGAVLNNVAYGRLKN